MTRFVDLFAGLGGFHLAMQSLGGECVCACEIQDPLRELYKANYGVMPVGDIKEVGECDVPEHDLLCAGFPCQPFSKAGVQAGLRDRDRGSVFFDIVRILKARKPEYLILENVAHFVKHDRGNTYVLVKQSLEDLGYSIDYRKYSPHQFGVPQIRERMYLVGRRSSLGSFMWPEVSDDTSKLSLRDVLDNDPSDARVISSQVESCLHVWQEFLECIPHDAKLPSFPIWSMEFKATYPYRKYESLGDVPLRILRNHRGCFGRSLNAWTREEVLSRVPSYARRGTPFPAWKQRFIQQNRRFYREHKQHIDPWLHKIKQFPPSLQKLEWNCQGEPRDIWKYVIQFRASGVRVKRPTTSPSLVAMTSTQVPIIAWEKRYMTARECARLQSMDGLAVLPHGAVAMSAFGNAVNVTVARAILERLLAS